MMRMRSLCPSRSICDTPDLAPLYLSLPLCTSLYPSLPVVPYRVWVDSRTVNVIASACTSTMTRVVVAALQFFLGMLPVRHVKMRMTLCYVNHITSSDIVCYLCFAVAQPRSTVGVTLVILCLHNSPLCFILCCHLLYSFWSVCPDPVTSMLSTHEDDEKERNASYHQSFPYLS